MKMLRPILSFFMICLVFFASTNVLVGVHFCGGHLQEVSWLDKADGCGMEKDILPCHRAIAKSCCDDQTIVHDAQSFKTDLTKFQLHAPVATFVEPPVIIDELIPSLSVVSAQRDTYDPPLRSFDITLSVQVFLI